jgi:hypothetical protein
VVDATGRPISNEAELVTASARFSWPLARGYLAVSVQDLMAADTQVGKLICVQASARATRSLRLCLPQDLSMSAMPARHGNLSRRLFVASQTRCCRESVPRPVSELLIWKANTAHPSSGSPD